MKTLPIEVQVAIINEAGSTYRNSFLSMLRDASIDQVGQVAKNASEIADHFIEKIVSKYM